MFCALYNWNFFIGIKFRCLKSATLIIRDIRKIFASHTILFSFCSFKPSMWDFLLKWDQKGSQPQPPSLKILKRNQLLIYSCHYQEPRESAQGQMCVQNNDWVNMETNAHPSMNSFGLFPVSSLAHIQKSWKVPWLPWQRFSVTMKGCAKWPKGKPLWEISNGLSFWYAKF